MTDKEEGRAVSAEGRWRGAAWQVLAKLRREGMSAETGRCIAAMLEDARASYPDTIVDQARVRREMAEARTRESEERMRRAEDYAQALEAEGRDLRARLAEAEARAKRAEQERDQARARLESAPRRSKREAPDPEQRGGEVD